MDFTPDSLYLILGVVGGCVLSLLLARFLIVAIPFIFSFFRWLFRRLKDFFYGFILTSKQLIKCIRSFIAKVRCGCFKAKLHSYSRYRHWKKYCKNHIGKNASREFSIRRYSSIRRKISNLFTFQIRRFWKLYLVVALVFFTFILMLVLSPLFSWVDTVIYIYVIIVVFSAFSFVGYLVRTITEDRDLLRNATQDCFSISGYKGSGKDLVCYFLACQGPHYSNIRYNSMSKVFDVKDLEVGDNNYLDLCNGVYHPIPKKFEEGIPVILSDMGIYAASHIDKVLKKKFENMAIAIAVWRHLYNAPVGYNVQCHERVQLIIREQANVFFRCLNSEVFTLFGKKIAVTNLIYYQDIKGLEARVFPLSTPFFASREYKEEVDRLNLERYQKYGDVRAVRLVQVLGEDIYDTRIFHQYFFGYPSPN